MSLSTVQSRNVPPEIEMGREYQAGDFLRFPSLPTKGALIRISGAYPALFNKAQPSPLYLVIAEVTSKILGVDATDFDAVYALRRIPLATLLMDSTSPIIAFKDDSMAIETSEHYRKIRVLCTIAALSDNYFEHLENCAITGGCNLRMEFPEPTFEHRAEVCRANSIHRTRPHYELNGLLEEYQRNPNFVQNLYADPKRINTNMTPEIIAQKRARDSAILESGDKTRISRLQTKVSARLQGDTLDWKRFEFLQERAKELEKSHPIAIGCTSLPKHQELLRKLIARNIAIIPRQMDDLSILARANDILGIVPEAEKNEETCKVFPTTSIIWRGVLTDAIYNSYGLWSIEEALAGSRQKSGPSLEAAKVTEQKGD